MNVKTCSKCAETKPVEAFFYRKDRGTYRADCRECCNARSKAYHTDNRQAIVERKADYRAVKVDVIKKADSDYRRKNRNRIQQQNAEYRAANRESRAQAERERYRANPEAMRVRQREARRSNPAVYRAYGITRRRRAREAAGRATAYQVKARVDFYGGRCWMCGGAFEAIDHVKPLAKGGSNWPANLRPACNACNSAKHAVWPLSVALERVRTIV